jgi:hypothetical protein
MRTLVLSLTARCCCPATRRPGGRLAGERGRARARGSAGAHEEHEVEPDDPLYWSSEPRDPLQAINCAEHKDTGYVKGDAFEITVVTIDGKPVEVETANAFYQMAQAAAQAGVNIKVVSGFRTMAEQQYLYNCYINCSCNNCNLAAKPGYSNHQSGHALDLNTGGAGGARLAEARTAATTASPRRCRARTGTGSGGAADRRPAGRAGSRTSGRVRRAVVPAGRDARRCCSTSARASTRGSTSKNTGKATWTANTRLAPTPRDLPSPLVDAGWLSPTRITGPQADTAPGAVGPVPASTSPARPRATYVQTFGLVEEGVSWFSHAPKGGGPPDSQLAVHVVVLEPPPPFLPAAAAAAAPVAAAGAARTSAAGGRQRGRRGPHRYFRTGLW